MLWAALLVCAWPETDAVAAARDDATARALAVWALQFTPRVRLLEQAVLLELESSLRLFGGLAALRRRLQPQAVELGARALAWAATAQGALALARGGVAATPPRDLGRALDRLPLHCLRALAEQAPLLQRLGCRCLGDVRRLPRAGLARRCGPLVLQQLDQAYGEVAEHHPWFALPPGFEARLELPARVDDAQALLFAARRLLLQLQGWLAARQAGATAWLLGWRFDTLAAHSGDGCLQVRSALPLRDADELARLLGEHLRNLRLPAPVLELRLELQDMQPLVACDPGLEWAPRQPGAHAGSARELTLALQRVAARLGAQRVLQGAVLPDHRPEWAQRWHEFGSPQPAAATPQPAAALGPRPVFLLPEPLPLATRHGRPTWHGPLQLLLGPQRIEGGWWQRDPAGGSRHLARDYWVAGSERCGLLWVFRDRHDPAAAPRWFVHGVFA